MSSLEASPSRLFGRLVLLLVEIDEDVHDLSFDLRSGKSTR